MEALGPLVSENLGREMCEFYRAMGIFAHEAPVRDVVTRLERLQPEWIHGMHGGSLGRETIPGFATVLCIVLLLGGIQLITIGIIGEYVGRIYDEVKGRPLYLVRSSRNLGPGAGRQPEPEELDRLTAP